MASEGTHIRFALDLKDKYSVQDIKKYLSGSIYPDSRYSTHMDRGLTHPEDYKTWDLSRLDDFKKGWLTHLLADDIQTEITRELLPQVFEGVQSQGSEQWIRRTAIKVLQDMDDIKKFDIKKVLPLAYVENPNGEDVQVMSRYNDIFSKLYSSPAMLNSDSYSEAWKTFGMRDELAGKIKVQVEAYARDQAVLDAIRRIYPEMIARASL